MEKGSLWLGVILWIVAFLLMGASAVYQRMTGPTHPMRVSYTANGASFKARLVRSGTTGEDAEVQLPALPTGWKADLHWRRYPTEEDHQVVPFRRSGEELTAPLPTQLAAGKVEYFIVLGGDGSTIRLPADTSDDPVLRYKGAVPAWALVPHILMMFLAMWVGVRAGLGALLGLQGTRRLAWVTLGGLFLGGLVLGPIVQKYAFGEFWTGWPNGYDLTDNKLLLTWVVWLVACLVIGWRRGRRERAGRIAVVVATLVMLGVYLIPHSMRGSELDYEKVGDGVAPAEAIRTG